MANDADYERVINQARATGEVKREDRQLAQTLQNEQSARRRRYRRAAGTDSSADSWGF
jgi:hypothetical protein